MVLDIWISRKFALNLTHNKAYFTLNNFQKIFCEFLVIFMKINNKNEHIYHLKHWNKYLIYMTT